MKVFCHIRVKIYLLYFFCFLSLNGICQWQKIEEPYGGYVNNIAQVDNLIFAGGYFLFVSDDYGTSWEKVEAFPSFQIKNLLGYDGFLLATTYAGIYRSSDHGLSWEQLDPPVTGRYIELLCRANNTLVAYVPNSLTPSGIYLSEDNGETWSTPVTPFTPQIFISLQTIDEVLYACSVGEIFRSTDSGHHWEVFTSKIYYCTSLTYANNQFIAVNMFNCYRSNDGITWDTVSTNFYKPFCIHALDSVGFKSQRLLLGVSTHGLEDGYPGGLFYSDDNGSNWFPVDDVNNRNDNITCILETDSALFAGTGTEGIVRSFDAADHWEISNKGISCRDFYKISADENIILVTGRNEIEQFLSTDYGKTWHFQDLPEISGDPSLHSILVANNRLWIATREGLYFRKVSDSLWNVKMPDSSFYFLTEANQIIYAATRRTLFKTTDQGESWTVCNNTAGLPWIMCISAKENTVIAVLDDSVMYSHDAGAHFYSSELPGFWHNHIYPTHDGKDFFIISESMGIYLSVDDGVNWQKVNDSTLLYLYSVEAGPGCIFISTRDGGVIRSTDKGCTWKRYNEGFPGYATSVAGLALSGDTLYAVGLTDYSTGIGIYKRSSFPAGITPMEKHETGMRIHPNPVAGSFTISIRDQMLSNIPFSIISNNGKKMLNGYIGADGKINVESLPSDTYVIEIYHQERWYAVTFIKK